MPSLGEYDANVAPLNPKDPVPTGWYRCMLTGSEVKPTSDKTGDRLVYHGVIMEGEFVDSEFDIGLNIRNPNKKAEQIAHREFKAICEAVGIQSPRESEQAHNILLWVKLELVPPQKDKLSDKIYPAKNEARDYRSDKDGPKKMREPIMYQPAGNGPDCAQPAQTPTPAPTQSQPWKRSS